MIRDVGANMNVNASPSRFNEGARATEPARGSVGLMLGFTAAATALFFLILGAIAFAFFAFFLIAYYSMFLHR